MPRRHALPRLWLMTDERQGDRLWHALERLPRGAGVVFRHYGLVRAERRALFEQVRAVARRRMLVLVASGMKAILLKVDGFHTSTGAPAKAGAQLDQLRSKRHLGSRLRGSTESLRTASAHNRRELIAAERAGADLVFLSPLYATRSHPGARPLGRIRFAALARATRLPVVALGGMTARRARGLPQLGAHGWAAIDAWSR